MLDMMPAKPKLSRPVAADIPLLRSNPFGAPDPIYTALGYAGHPGIDFEAPEGTPVYACAAGIVGWAAPAGTAGNMVRLVHHFGKTRYLHMSEISVQWGDAVTRGQQLGLSGNTGDTTGPHLHLDLYLVGVKPQNGYGGRVDPLPYIVDSRPPSM